MAAHTLPDTYETAQPKLRLAWRAGLTPYRPHTDNDEGLPLDVIADHLDPMVLSLVRYVKRHEVY